MTKRKGTPARGKNTVTIDLDALRKAVEELAPGCQPIERMERLLCEGESIEGGLEKELVRVMALDMHTVLERVDSVAIKEILVRVAGLMGLLEAVASGGTLDKVSPHDLSALAEEAYEKLYAAKSLMERGTYKVKEG